MTDFMRRLKSSVRLHVDVNEKNMFRCSLWLLGNGNGNGNGNDFILRG